MSKIAARRKFCSAKFPCDENSLRQNLQGAKTQRGEFSMRQKFLAATFLFLLSRQWTCMHVYVRRLLVTATNIHACVWGSAAPEGVRSVHARSCIRVHVCLINQVQESVFICTRVYVCISARAVFMCTRQHVCMFTRAGKILVDNCTECTFKVPKRFALQIN